MRAKLFTVPLYSTRLYVVVGRDIKGEWLYRHVAKKFKVEIPKLRVEVEDCEGSCNANGDLIVMFLRNLGDSGVVAHECLHAVAENMRYVGCEFSEESEEAWTYLLGWMVDTINEWRKRGGPR